MLPPKAWQSHPLNSALPLGLQMGQALDTYNWQSKTTQIIFFLKKYIYINYIMHLHPYISIYDWETLKLKNVPHVDLHKCYQETNSSLGIQVHFDWPAGSAKSGQSFAHCPEAVCTGKRERL
jgi:hypothetical protein